jgi:hypothetical protein
VKGSAVLNSCALGALARLVLAGLTTSVSAAEPLDRCPLALLLRRP